MGTSFSNPIGRGNRSRYHESSRLRSPRDSDVVPKIWQKGVKVEDQLFRVAQACEQLQRQLNRLRMRKGGEEGQSEPVSGMVFKGEWVNTTVYDSQNVVFRTPIGGSRGAYIALADNIPAGTMPESGAPWWAAWPYPPSGLWG